MDEDLTPPADLGSPANPRNWNWFDRTKAEKDAAKLNTARPEEEWPTTIPIRRSGFGYQGGHHTQLPVPPEHQIQNVGCLCSLAPHYAEITQPHRTECGSIEADPGPVAVAPMWPPMWTRAPALVAQPGFEIRADGSPCEHMRAAEQLLKDCGISVVRDPCVDEDIQVRCHYCGITCSWGTFGVPTR